MTCRRWLGRVTASVTWWHMQSEVSCIPIYEGMPHLTQQIATYEEAGFASAGMFPVTWDHETLAVIEFDVLMVRREIT